MRRNFFGIALLAAGLLITGLSSASHAARRSSSSGGDSLPITVVIDPGHGGSPTDDPTQLRDPGVVVGAVMEKDITLDLAMRLRKLLQRERVKVVLTRSGDQYVEISERWNRAQAAPQRVEPYSKNYDLPSAPAQRPAKSRRSHSGRA